MVAVELIAAEGTVVGSVAPERIAGGVKQRKPGTRAEDADVVVQGAATTAAVFAPQLVGQELICVERGLNEKLTQ